MRRWQARGLRSGYGRLRLGGLVVLVYMNLNSYHAEGHVLEEDAYKLAMVPRKVSSHLKNVETPLNLAQTCL